VVVSVVTLLRWARVLGIALCAFGFSNSAHAIRPIVKIHAIWVYPDPTQPVNDPVLNAVAGQKLIANARASNVNMIYLSVYRSTPNSQGRLLYDETLMANLLAAAHLGGMQVFAAYGGPDWPTLGCGTPQNPSFPVQRVKEIGAYNATSPSAPVYDPVTNATYTVNALFNGVILDVEPATADQSLLTLYACSQQTAQLSYLSLSVAINAFWNYPIGTGGLAYQQILDMNFSNVVIMGYRSVAGTFGVADNGIIAIDKDVVAYKRDGSTVLLGLETKNLAQDPQTSFYAAGQAALDYQAQSVYNQFAQNGYDFGGFAIHNYAYSYLGGTPSWPSTDPIFPVGASIQPVVSNSSTAVDIGSTLVTLTFTGVANSNATVTVTPANPATQMPAPSGFLLSDLAFDISTTAVLTGPVTVCFVARSLDAAAFAGLRVLHYVGGVPLDQTILSGPNAPNPASQVICASVTSFSPFVLAYTTSVAMTSFQVGSFTAGKANFHLEGDFALPAGATVTAGVEVALTLGTAVLKIPAGQLKQDGHDDHFNFEGSVNGDVQLHVELQRDGNQPYTFKIDGQTLDLTKQAEPVNVNLQIGKYLGGAIVFARVDN
jgi:hypothetical protein